MGVTHYDQLTCDMTIAMSLRKVPYQPLRENLNVNDITAYHAIQSIEKSLRYLVDINCSREDRNLISKSHNLTVYVMMLDKAIPGFADKHQSLVDLSPALTRSNALRYGRAFITEDHLDYLIATANQLNSEAKRAFMEKHPDRAENREFTIEYMKNQREIMEDNPSWTKRDFGAKDKAFKPEPKTLHDLQIDLMTAQMILNSKVLENNPMRNCYAAYHAGQCIEKCLNYYAQVTCKDSDYRQVATTHDIGEVLEKIKQVNPRFEKAHKFLCEKTDVFTRLNSARYGTFRVEDSSVNSFMKIARDLYKEIEKIYTRLYPDAEARFQYMKDVHDSREDIVDKTKRQMLVSSFRESYIAEVANYMNSSMKEVESYIPVYMQDAEKIAKKTHVIHPPVSRNAQEEAEQKQTSFGQEEKGSEISKKEKSPSVKKASESKGSPPSDFGNR